MLVAPAGGLGDAPGVVVAGHHEAHRLRPAECGRRRRRQQAGRRQGRHGGRERGGGQRHVAHFRQARRNDRRAGLADLRAAAGRLLEAGFQQVRHADVAAGGRVAAHDDADQAPAATLRRGDEVEAGRVDEAGLDAVQPLELVEQAVVIVVVVAAEGEAAGCEQGIVLGVVAQQRPGQHGEVARGGDLARVGQARGIAESGAGHAETPRPDRHHPREGALRSGHRLGDHRRGIVGGLGDEAQHRLLDGDGHAGTQRQAPRHGGCVGGHGKVLVHSQAPLLERLERQVEGHDLGDRRRMARGVGIDLVQDVAGACIEHDGGVAVLGSLHRLAARCRLGLRDGQRDHRRNEDSPDASPDRHDPMPPAHHRFIDRESLPPSSRGVYA